MTLYNCYPGPPDERLEQLLEVVQQEKPRLAVRNFIASKPTTDQMLSACVATSRFYKVDKVQAAVARCMNAREGSASRIMDKGILLETLAYLRFNDWVFSEIKRLPKSIPSSLTGSLIRTYNRLGMFEEAIKLIYSQGGDISDLSRAILSTEIQIGLQLYSNVERELSEFIDTPDALLLISGAALLEKKVDVARSYEHRLRQVPRVFMDRHRQLILIALGQGPRIKRLLSALDATKWTNTNYVAFSELALELNRRMDSKRDQRLEFLSDPPAENAQDNQATKP